MATKTYTTSQGDMWDAMAKRLLGSELLMGKFIEANRQYASTVIFSAGVVLVVPEIDTVATQQYPLPPWKTQ